MIGAAVGVDDEIGLQVRPGRLHQDMDLLGLGRAALGVADDPAHGVAGGDGTGADKLLARLQGDVRHLSRRGIDLIERAGREWIDLHGIDEAVAHRLDARCLVRLRDAVLRILRLRRRLGARHRLQLTGQRQRLRKLDHLHRRRRFGGLNGRHEIIIGDVGRKEFLRAPAESPRRRSEEGS